MLWVAAALAPAGRAGRLRGIPYWHQALVLLPDSETVQEGPAESGP